MFNHETRQQKSTDRSIAEEIDVTERALGVFFDPAQLSFASPELREPRSESGGEP